ncbi:Hypothetical protein CINCED_3A015823 [Cinara cedri]|uniref:Uncharacterized protein n=1 Tax=Cinara cedri TaxID=506608 RepID=A0A5E4N322_9HEMI|nr:Hypothetical protein CINCED_3A015823 [Cinara cedri]
MEEKTQMMNAVRAADDKAAVVHAVMHQTAMQQVRGVNRPPSMSIVGHHHHHHHHHQPHHQQQQPLAHLHHHSRTVGSGLVMADFRSEPAVVTTPIILDPRIVIGGGAGERRPVINGCGGGSASPYPVFQPRPVYPIPMPPTAMWHHTPSHFPASNAFAPFIEDNSTSLDTQNKRNQRKKSGHYNCMVTGKKAEDPGKDRRNAGRIEYDMTSIVRK